MSPGDPTILWTVGDPSSIPAEFTAPLFMAPELDRAFRVGEDDPRKDWPSFHPGPLNPATRFKEVTREIVFDLAEASAGAHELVLDMFIGIGPAPSLEVDLNGSRGTFFLTPERIDREKILFPPSPISGHKQVVARFPEGTIKQGGNSLKLTTRHVGTPIGEDEKRPSIGRGSGILYYGIGMRRIPEPSKLEPSAQLIATPLYLRRGEDLVELADLIVDAPSGFTSGNAEVNLNGTALKVEIEPDGSSFGQVMRRIEVPELPGPAQAKIKLQLDSETHEFETDFRPHRKWTVHVLPHVHLDIGYTDYQGKVIELHSRNLERATELLAENPEYAFSVDGSWILRWFFETRKEESARPLLDAMRAGRISVNAFFALFMTGLASLEECYRAGYLAEELSEKLDFKIDYANLTDVPSYSFAIPSVLNDLGINRFMGIENHGRASTEDSDEQHLNSPCWWEGPDGSRVMTFFSDCYRQLLFLLGDVPTIAGGEDSFTRLLARYERDDYAPADFPIVGTHGDNEDLGEGVADFVDRWNSNYEYPKLRWSTISSYFDEIEKYSDQLPVLTGDGGSYWEDGVGAAASAMATYRQAQSLLPVVESAFALASTVTPSLKPPRSRLDAAWDGLLIGCEHTWTSAHSIYQPHIDQSTDQLHWKTHQIADSLRTTRDEHRRAMSQLGEIVTTDGHSLVLFNSSSWDREGDVELDLLPQMGFLDEQGKQVPLDVIQEVDRSQRIRIRTKVPAFGYRVLKAKLDKKPRPSKEWEPAGSIVETDRYRLELDSGGRPVQLVDLETKKPLLDSDEYALGEVVYVKGGGSETGRGLMETRTKITDIDWFLPDPELELIKAKPSETKVKRTPWGMQVRIVSSAPTLPLVTTTIDLPNSGGRVDVSVTLKKEATLAKESVYVAFPFAVEDPSINYDRQVGWVDPAKDHRPGACNEWFTIHNAVGVSGRGHSVVWTSADAPLFTVDDVVRGKWPREFECQKGHLFSWVMNNYWWTNYPASQSGVVQLRYAFAPSESWDPAAAARFGREVRTPLGYSEVRGLDKADRGPRVLPSQGGTLLDCEAPENVIAWVQGHRDGGAMVVRVQETAGRSGVARLRFPHLGAVPTSLATASERTSSSLPSDEAGVVEVELGPFEVKTLVFDTGSTG